MIEKLLESIGLSDKEIAMYVTLLKSGMQPISVLSKKAGLNRGTGYVILHSLLDKGLIVKTTRKKIQYFAPLDPEQLIQYVDHREHALRTSREQLKAAMGQLTALMHPLTAKPKIEFFDGQEGARFVLNQTLQAKEKVLYSFLSIADTAEFVGIDFFSDYTDRRIKAGYTLRALRTLEKDRQALKRDAHAVRYVTSKKEKREIRHVPDNLAFPITMYMFDDYLAIISSKDEGFSLLIQSLELVRMQKKIFDLLWATYGK
jgi:sugar-specific transcriptional regulator TrmB